jgi:hypothetical protein
MSSIGSVSIFGAKLTIGEAASFLLKKLIVFPQDTIIGNN